MLAHSHQEWVQARGFVHPCTRTLGCRRSRHGCIREHIQQSIVFPSACQHSGCSRQGLVDEAPCCHFSSMCHRQGISDALPTGLCGRLPIRCLKFDPDIAALYSAGMVKERGDLDFSSGYPAAQLSFFGGGSLAAVCQHPHDTIRCGIHHASIHAYSSALHTRAYMQQCLQTAPF
jgi:hypothetical protein